MTIEKILETADEALRLINKEGFDSMKLNIDECYILEGKNNNFVLVATADVEEVDKDGVVLGEYSRVIYNFNGELNLLTGTEDFSVKQVLASTTENRCYGEIVVPFTFNTAKGGKRNEDNGQESPYAMYADHEWRRVVEPIEDKKDEKQLEK